MQKNTDHKGIFTGAFFDSRRKAMRTGENQKLGIHIKGGDVHAEIDGHPINNIAGLKIESLDKDLYHFNVTFELRVYADDVDFEVEQKFNPPKV